MGIAIEVERFGGPEVLNVIERDVAPPRGADVQIRHTAIGLNLIDTYHRTGLYPLELPLTPGSEAAGEIVACGPDCREFSIGDRVVYCSPGGGSYCQLRNYPEQRLVRIPPALDDRQAAAAMLKGLTAWYLLHRSFRVSAGDTVLLFAAAGGVGSIACQWAKKLGVRVIGVVSSAEKERLAERNGCWKTLQYRAGELAPAVRELTGGEGVAAVYDSIGRETFFESLDCLRPHGVMVSFGNASGPPPQFAVAELAKRGSLFVTRPVLFDFVRERKSLLQATDCLFQAIAEKTITIHINQTYALSDVRQAHADLEGRRTTGSTVLLPD